MSRTLGSDTCESEGRSVLVVRGWVERSCQQPDDTSLQKSVKCTSGMTGCVVQGHLEWSALTESARCMILLQANNSTNKAQLMFWKNKHFGDLQLILQGFYTLMKGFQHCWYQDPRIWSHCWWNSTKHFLMWAKCKSVKLPHGLQHTHLKKHDST